MITAIRKPSDGIGREIFVPRSVLALCIVFNALCDLIACSRATGSRTARSRVAYDTLGSPRYWLARARRASAQPRTLSRNPKSHAHRATTRAAHPACPAHMRGIAKLIDRSYMRARCADGCNPRRLARPKQSIYSPPRLRPGRRGTRPSTPGPTPVHLSHPPALGPSPCECHAPARDNTLPLSQRRAGATPMNPPQ